MALKIYYDIYHTDTGNGKSNDPHRMRERIQQNSVSTH